MFTASVKIKGGLEQKARELDKLKGTLRVGFLDGGKYIDGTSIPYVAYLNEYGMDHNPERPFMHRTVENNCNKWMKGIKTKLASEHLSQKLINEALHMCGNVAVGDMKRMIKDWPPGDPRKNSPRTIAMKRERGDGTNDPEAALIDSRTMISSVNYEVTEE